MGEEMMPSAHALPAQVRVCSILLLIYVLLATTRILIFSSHSHSSPSCQTNTCRCSRRCCVDMCSSPVVSRNGGCKAVWPQVSYSFTHDTKHRSHMVICTRDSCLRCCQMKVVVLQRNGRKRSHPHNLEDEVHAANHTTSQITQMHIKRFLLRAAVSSTN